MKRFFSFFLFSTLLLLLAGCSTPEVKQSLVTYSSKNIVGFDNKTILIDYQFLPAMYRIGSYAAMNNVKVVVTSSFRTPNQKLTGTIVPPAKNSNHLAGHAIDMNVEYNGVLYESDSLKKANLKNLPPNVRNFISAVRHDKGLQWGGDFLTEDPVHIDDGLNDDMVAWQQRVDACQYGIVGIDSKQ